MGLECTNSIQYSTDGKNWTGISNGFNGSIGQKVKFNGTYWLAIGFDSNNGAIKYSQDGSNWINAGIGVFDINAYDLAWSGKMWVAAGHAEGAKVNASLIYSYDGFTWSAGVNTLSNYAQAVAWNGEYFVATGDNDVSPIRTKYSYDGIHWINTDSQNAGLSLGWNGQYWLLVGLTTISKSYNGSNWVDVSPLGGIGQSGIAWNGEYWMLVSQCPLGSVLVSLDGSTWTTSLNGSNFANNAFPSGGGGVTWDGSKWYIVGRTSISIIKQPNTIKYSGKDLEGNFIWIDAESGGFSSSSSSNRTGGIGIAYNTPQLPYLQNGNLTLYQRTNTQPLYDTPSNNFIKTTETSLNINNTLYVNISTIASTNVTYFNSKVGIFESNPTYSLHLAYDSAFKPGTNTWTYTSDRRVKENIQEANLETCASTLGTLPLRTYSYISSFAEKTGLSQEQRYGFIAQEVDIPHTVTKKPGYGFEDFHYLNVDQIQFLHLGATQVLLEHVKDQESTIEGLQQMILDQRVLL